MAAAAARIETYCRGYKRIHDPIRSGLAARRIAAALRWHFVVARFAQNDRRARFAHPLSARRFYTLSLATIKELAWVAFGEVGSCYSCVYFPVSTHAGFTVY